VRDVLAQERDGVLLVSGRERLHAPARPARPFPPEPVRYVGAHVVRNAVGGRKGLRLARTITSPASIEQVRSLTPRLLRN